MEAGRAEAMGCPPTCRLVHWTARKRDDVVCDACDRPTAKREGMWAVNVPGFGRHHPKDTPSPLNRSFPTSGRPLQQLEGRLFSSSSVWLASFPLLLEPRRHLRSSCGLESKSNSS